MIDDLPISPSTNIPNPEGKDEMTVQYETELLKWISAAVVDGEAILKADPSYDSIEKSIAYIMGDQIDSRRPTELSAVNINKLKDIILQTVSSLTDLHPLFGFKTFNAKFHEQGETLNNLARAWWVNSFSDLRLADVVKFGSVCGTGYCEVIWNESAAGGAGDIELIARDPRDILPIRPTMDPSLQTWEGVIIRSSKSLNELRARFPEKARRLIADNHPMSITERMWRKFKGVGNKFSSPAVDHLTGGAKSSVPRVPSIDLYQVYLKDRRLFKGAEPIIIGDPETNWSYTVYPVGHQMEDGKTASEDDSRLYPRGRLVIATRSVVLYDGPNPYWHGMFPILKLSLDPWPWSMLGVGLAKDLMPMQDAVNETANGILDHIRKVLRPGVIGDKKAVPESQWQRLDTRVPGLKIKTNSTMGSGIELTKVDALPLYVFDFLKLAVATMDQLGGTANLQALTQVNQIPGEDTIEKMQEALTPILRLRGRLLEAFLRELGEIVKCNFFQFYNMPRRVSILGESGINFQDFDFDPGTLVPAMGASDAGYMPEYDVTKFTRAQRAKKHMKSFTFQITPNSMLAVSQLSRKLLYLQLFRAGLMDPWTLFEILEIPNGGEPPDGAKTITERLVAMQMMGLGQTVSPAGRKASGQESPSMKVKKDSAGMPRVTTSESGSGGG